MVAQDDLALALAVETEGEVDELPGVAPRGVDQQRRDLQGLPVDERRAIAEPVVQPGVAQDLAVDHANESQRLWSELDSIPAAGLAVVAEQSVAAASPDVLAVGHDLGHADPGIGVQFP